MMVMVAPMPVTGVYTTREEQRVYYDSRANDRDCEQKVAQILSINDQHGRYSH
jgi:hypothetical protein